MKFGLAQIATADIGNRSSIIISLSKEIEDLYAGHFFGRDLLDIAIGIICVNEQFEQFFKENKRYYKGRRGITHDNITVVVENALEYSIKLPFEVFVDMDEKEARDFLIRRIYVSLDIIGSIKQIKDFDLVAFKDFYKSELMSGLD